MEISGVEAFASLSMQGLRPNNNLPFITVQEREMWTWLSEAKSRTLLSFPRMRDSSAEKVFPGTYGNTRTVVLF